MKAMLLVYIQEISMLAQFVQGKSIRAVTKKKKDDIYFNFVYEHSMSSRLKCKGIQKNIIHYLENVM